MSKITRNVNVNIKRSTNSSENEKHSEVISMIRDITSAHKLHLHLIMHTIFKISFYL